MAVELWALYVGFELALKFNFGHIIVELNYSPVFNLLHGDWEDTHPLHGLLSNCKRHHMGNWNYQVTHVYQECNIIVDALAHLGQTRFGVTCIGRSP